MPEKQAQNPQTPRSENYNVSSSIPQVDGALPRIFTLLPVNWQSWPCAKVPRGLARTGGFFVMGCRGNPTILYGLHMGFMLCFDVGWYCLDGTSVSVFFFFWVSWQMKIFLDESWVLAGPLSPPCPPDKILHYLYPKLCSKIPLRYFKMTCFKGFLWNRV